MGSFRAVNPHTAEEFGPEIHNFTKEDVDNAIDNARPAILAPAGRAELLRAIAAAIESDRAGIVEIAMLESGLPEARLNGELTRTVFQVNEFANFVETGRNLGATIDLADANYGMGPRPDIRRHNQALGTVAVFAASNFPLAFSVAGGDAISALAAGNAVVLKGHPSHPNTSQRVFDAIQNGIGSVNQKPELFSLIQGNDPQITHWLATHPKIQAIGFTGSGAVGRLLVKLAAERKVPIPVYAEMGSINPVFITKAAATTRPEELAKGSVDSALLGSGQFCTKPGLFVVSRDGADEFIAHVEKYLSTMSVGPLLNKAIAERYSSAIVELSKNGSLKIFTGKTATDGIAVTPTFFVTDWTTVSTNSMLLEEHFGPTSVIAIANEEDFISIAKSLEGQLTATIQCADDEAVRPLMSALSTIAGRVIRNAYPTGVSVTAAMQHGGPWPAASTHSTSVGTDAIFRFMRPVAYQGFSEELLPPTLQLENPWKIEQTINGKRI